VNISPAHRALVAVDLAVSDLDLALKLAHARDLTADLGVSELNELRRFVNEALSEFSAGDDDLPEDVYSAYLAVQTALA
jgi:hypothetical protein